MWFTFMRSTFLKLQIGAIERELGAGLISIGYFCFKLEAKTPLKGAQLWFIFKVFLNGLSRKPLKCIPIVRTCTVL